MLPTNCTILTNVNPKPLILPTEAELATTASLKIKLSVFVPAIPNTVPPGAVNVTPLILPPLVPENMVPPDLNKISSLVSKPMI